MDQARLAQRLRDFAVARDWEQFHSPKNLVMALSAEVGELTEIFQWLSEDGSRTLAADDRRRVREEIADVQIYLLRLADLLEVDLEKAVDDKIALNEAKYPIAQARGNATKYNRRGEEA